MPKNASGREYNKELREQIKDAGRELIDRVDEIVHPNAEGIISLDIHFNFSQGTCDIPTMSYTMEVIGKNTIERWNRVSKASEPDCKDCLYFDTNSAHEPCVSCYRNNHFVRKE